LVPYLDAEYLSVSDPEEVTVRHLLDESVRSAVQKLEERESTVLRRRFGLDGKDEETLAEVGTQLNLSRERVRQIEAGAIEKLRDSGNLRGFLDPNFDDGS
jgi:RNA polymerase sigma factor (sigma-70 family)